MADDKIQQRIDAYHQLCPELDEFLKDDIDTGEVLAHRLDLTPGQWNQAIGRNFGLNSARDRTPAGFLGGTLLKVLREEAPRTTKEPTRDYTAEEKDFFWERAQLLAEELNDDLKAKLKSRQADSRLWKEVRNSAGRRPVFTVTGRLRANAAFCSSRNCMFQGTAADGALLGLWLVWRSGYKIVDFIHDQLVVETPADEKVKDRVAHVEGLMKEGMLKVVPNMKVQVESFITASLNKKDLDPRFDVRTKELVLR